jgi:hypothetical protein
MPCSPTLLLLHGQLRQALPASLQMLGCCNALFKKLRMPLLPHHLGWMWRSCCSSLLLRCCGCHICKQSHNSDSDSSTPCGTIGAFRLCLQLPSAWCAALEAAPARLHQRQCLPGLSSPAAAMYTAKGCDEAMWSTRYDMFDEHLTASSNCQRSHLLLLLPLCCCDACC